MTSEPTLGQTGSFQTNGHHMSQQLVRDEVAAFRQRGAYGRSQEDCFPAWYLHHRHRVAASDAVAQTADGADGVRRNYDFGLDAFHLLEEDREQPTLLLIQAKFTDSLTAVASGLRDLLRALPRVAEALTVSQSMAVKENRVLVSLRERLRLLDPETRRALRLRFEVIHLSDADELMVRANTRRAFDDLRQALSDDAVFESWRHEIDLIGPARMGEIIPQTPLPPAIWHELSLDAVPLAVKLDGRDVTMYSGIGRLRELVELYNRRRGDLFAKNVRYFVANKQNEERGPAGKIKETLDQMCIRRRGTASAEPELFAFLHNGITIFAREVEVDGSGHISRVREPYVLNGCQTVRSAYDFRYDARRSARIDETLWGRVAVPVRVITTKDDLIRQITISNNRQNQIAASALRANDPIQLELEQRLAGCGIFYERQRGAFDELQRSNSDRVSMYHRSNGRAVEIDHLARCLAAVAGEFDLAHSPSHIFEYDTAYQRVFSETRLASISLLVLLQNLHDVLPVILKNDLGLEPQTRKGPKKSRLTYFTLCLLVRHLAKNRMEDWVGEYGNELLGKEKGFRDEVASLLGNYRSKIKQALKDHFLSLDEASAETLRGAFRKASWQLNLRDTIDPFEIFRNLDSRVESVT